VEFVSKKEGIEIARQKGKYKGRRPVAINGGKFAAVYGRWKSGSIRGVEAMRELGLKPSTFYRRVREYKGASRGQE
jgi:DNA invertase Pin-like site-specific DNA recombinase